MVADAIRGDFSFSSFFPRQVFIKFEVRKLVCREHIILLLQGGLFRHFSQSIGVNGESDIAGLYGCVECIPCTRTYSWYSSAI
jgi:hypothetical protein